MLIVKISFKAYTIIAYYHNLLQRVNMLNIEVITDFTERPSIWWRQIFCAEPMQMRTEMKAEMLE